MKGLFPHLWFHLVFSASSADLCDENFYCHIFISLLQNAVG